MEIYKINQIALNQINSQFSLCYNNGIRSYKLSDYTLNSTSNNSEIIVGDVSIGTLLYELNVVVFTGSEHNELYNNKKLVVYDLSKHKEIYYTLFQNAITDIKAISKFIFVTSGNELTIYSYCDFKSISVVRTIQFLNKEYINYQLWISKKENENVGKIYICMLSEKGNSLTIYSYFDNEFEQDQIAALSFDYQKIQSFFYIEMYEMIFIVESTGKYFCSYDIKTFSKVGDYYRGQSEGKITSVCGIENNYIAVTNLNKTIHIFPIREQNAKTITTFLYNLVSQRFIYSSIKIKYQDIMKGVENDFYLDYFNKKGSVLVYSKETKNLNVICYNGFVYIIKINFNRMTYELVQTKNYFQENLENLGTSITLSSLSLNNSNEINKSKGQWKVI